MSRSNTNYYNVCDDPLDESGRCKWHQDSRWSRVNRNCIPPGVFFSRRTWERKKRFPNYGWKRYCPGPPQTIKRLWQRRLRAQMKREILRYGEVMIDAERKLAGWYGWWS